MLEVDRLRSLNAPLLLLKWLFLSCSVKGWMDRKRTKGFGKAAQEHISSMTNVLIFGSKV